jgi:hypothetical protein
MVNVNALNSDNPILSAFNYLFAHNKGKKKKDVSDESLKEKEKEKVK